MQKAYTDMGVMEFADIDAEALLEQDQGVAERYDQEDGYIKAVADAAGNRPPIPTQALVPERGRQRAACFRRAARCHRVFILQRRPG